MLTQTHTTRTYTTQHTNPNPKPTLNPKSIIKPRIITVRRSTLLIRERGLMRFKFLSMVPHGVLRKVTNKEMLQSSGEMVESSVNFAQMELRYDEHVVVLFTTHFHYPLYTQFPGSHCFVHRFHKSLSRVVIQI